MLCNHGLKKNYHTWKMLKERGSHKHAYRNDCSIFPGRLGNFSRGGYTWGELQLSSPSLNSHHSVLVNLIFWFFLGRTYYCHFEMFYTPSSYCFCFGFFSFALCLCLILLDKLWKHSGVKLRYYVSGVWMQTVYFSFRKSWSPVLYVTIKAVKAVKIITEWFSVSNAGVLPVLVSY